MTLRLADAGPELAPDAPVLVVDSGLGGLTVAAALRRRLPGERLVYVGDTARVPYGSKSPQAITAAVTGVVRAAIGRMEVAPKHVVVACNSASAVALPALREVARCGVSGVVEPGAKAAARAAGRRVKATIAVIATEATIRSRAYEIAVGRRRPRARLLLKATPLLVPIVEEGRKHDDPVVRLALEGYLRPLMDMANENGGRLDALVLGCTHYPLLRRAIREVVGERVAIVDSATAAAEDVAGRLTTAGLLRAGDAAEGVRLWATDLPHRVARAAERFLREPLLSADALDADEAAGELLRKSA